VVSTVARVGAELWDCVSDETVGPLLDFLPVAAGDHPLLTDNRRVWALLSARDPQAFSDRFLGLEFSGQLAFASELASGGIRLLSPAARDRLLSVLVEAANDRQLSDSEWRARVTLEEASADGDSLPPLELANASPAAIVDVVERDRSRVADADLSRAISQLTAFVRDRRAEARAGKIGMGPRSSAQLLASAVLATGGEPASALEALWESALDEELPGELRLEALGGLARVAADVGLSPDRRPELRDAPMTEGDYFGVAAAGSDLLRAARLLVLADQLNESEQTEALILGRSRDVRARELAVNAAGLARAKQPSDRLDQVVLAALFDPSEGVIRRGLNADAAENSSFSGEDEVLGRRFVELMETRRKATRAVTAQIARGFVEAGRALPESQQAVALARTDKSWRVRGASTPGGIDYSDRSR